MIEMNIMKMKLAIILSASMFVLAGAYGQNRVISIKSGESADIGVVYWVKNCNSTLQKVSGIEILDGNNPVLQFGVREELVNASRQNCASKVPGGVVYVTASQVAEKQSTVIKYRVKYETTDGQQQSTHSVQLDMYP